MMATQNDLTVLGSEMLSAVEKTLDVNDVELKSFVKEEVDRLLIAVARIIAMKEAGRMNAEKAGMMLALERDAFVSLSLTVKGVQKVRAENAVNAALGVLGVAVKRWFGWSIFTG